MIGPKPSERDLYEIDKLIDAAHQDAWKDCRRIQITVETDEETGRRMTFDIDAVEEIVRNNNASVARARLAEELLKNSHANLDNALCTSRAWRWTAIWFALIWLLSIYLHAMGVIR